MNGIDALINKDKGIEPFRDVLAARTAHIERAIKKAEKLRAVSRKTPFFIREWLPNATDVWLVGDFSGWKRNDDFRLKNEGNGWFSRRFNKNAFCPGQCYRMHVKWHGGEGERLPAAATIVARNTNDISRGDTGFDAVVPLTQKYKWKNAAPIVKHPLIYEAHVGMAQDKLGIGTFDDFREKILPIVRDSGYNVVQLMGVMQHPYYASFGYHVTNFYAVTDLLGTPESFKRLVDEAHGMGLSVIMDLVHSHSAPNVNEGLSQIDGTDYAYFHSGARGTHSAWGSRCFDYGKPEVLRFLADNCRFWLEEYHIDGFRFDGVTSMIYLDHGLGRGDWRYSDYFSENVDWDACAYLAYANDVIHSVNTNAITIAEEVSGFPGITVAKEQGGLGFDYRLAMGVTDYWFKLTDMRDEDWPMGALWHEATGKRSEERCISYVESHDQALVGGRTFFFTLAGKAMYDGMQANAHDSAVERAMALHKMARLFTFATADSGYLNFMGNEFGHPEWIDFPCERNNWSFLYARRQWHLKDDMSLKYHFLADFDKAMLALLEKDLFEKTPIPLLVDEERKVIAFSRGKWLFAFNFNPTQSFDNLPILCFPGKYDLVLDTDRAEFGGFGAIASKQEFFSSPTVEQNTRNNYIRIYLPARTALVAR